MPNVDRIYCLIKNIYLARALRFYTIEEDLFAMLIFIMRTRELAIVVTRRYETTAIIRRNRMLDYRPDYHEDDDPDLRNSRIQGPRLNLNRFLQAKDSMEYIGRHLERSKNRKRGRRSKSADR